MAVTKKIEIDGQMVEFRASAAVPRLYRIKFGRDIYKDLRSLEKSVGDNDEESSSLDLFSLEMFENIAYCLICVGWHQGCDLYSLGRYPVRRDLGGRNGGHRAVWGMGRHPVYGKHCVGGYQVRHL